MSLLNDPDYIAHALRLTYLRHVEDPYGNRVVSFNPVYSANPYIRAAGFADTDAWPQLNQPESPKPVESQLAPPASPSRDGLFLNGRMQINDDAPVAPEAGIYPGAKLKYTDTIMGPSRSGMAGIRVSGRRLSGNVQPRGSSVRSSTVLGDNQSRFRSDSAPNLVPGSANPQALGSQILGDLAPVAANTSGKDDERLSRRGSGGSAYQAVPISSPPDPAASNGSTPTATVSGSSRLASDPAISQVHSQSPPPAPAVALPIFARAAEMEERRRLRMRARFAPSPSNAVAANLENGSPLQASRNTSSAQRKAADTLSLAGTIDSRTSRDEDASGTIDGEGETIAEDSDDDDTDEDADADADADADDMDVEMAESGDQDDLSLLYNPTFTTTGVNPSGSSDENSFLSGNSTNSLTQPTSQSFALPLPRNRSRLSPVTEAAGLENQSASARHTPQSVRVPMPRPLSIHSPPAPPTPRASGTRSRAYSSAAGFRPPSPEEPPMVFTRQSVPPRAMSSKSALTEALAARSTVSNNPFSELYGAISGRAEQGAIPFRLWFPHANKVKDKDRRGRTIEKPFSLDVTVRKDAVAEELIGFGLWAYWESEQEPRLDEGLKNKSQAERDARLSAAGWNLRMWEDGEVDTDFPAIARTQTMTQIKTFEELAIVEATPEQVQQNLAAEASIARRPSRMIVTKPRQDSNTGGGLAPPGAVAGQTGPVPMMSSSDVVTSNLLTGVSIGGTTSVMPGGPSIFLKIKVAAKADVHYSTTINVTADTYMADVLEQVCRKRRLQDSKEWALMTENPSILIPLDRTVASLTGTKELLLVKRSLLDSLGLGKHSRVPRSSDPNASIFDMLQDANPGRGLSSSMDYREAYKKYTVHRKIPMLVGRHERIIAIDGDYVHIMPSNNRAFLDTMKTSSYHIKTVIGCKKTKKAPTSIKLVVLRDGGSKRYDFEAEDENQAGEIVETIKNLQKQYQLDRTGTLNKSKTVKRPKISTRRIMQFVDGARIYERGLGSAQRAPESPTQAARALVGLAGMSRRAPSPPGAPSHGRAPSARPTHYATHPTPSEQPLAPYVPPIFTQYDRPRAPSAASTATTVSSAASGSSLLSAQTDSTGITQLSNISSAKRSPPRELSGSHVVRPGPAPLQDSPGPFAPFRRSDPGQAPAPSSAHGSGGGLAPRRQTLPSETTTAFSRTRPFHLSQPPRGPRNTPARGSTSRALWGREGLPARQSDPRYTSVGPPVHPPSAPPYPHHVQHTRPQLPGARGPPNPQSPLFPPPPPPTQTGASFFSRGFPPSTPGHPSPGVETAPNPLSSSLTRGALLEHAYKLYDNPAPGSLAPMGLTTRLLQAETNKPELTDPMHTYRAELLPLLGLMRALHPNHTPIALLLGCVQYAVKDYEGSLRTNREILATDPNCVEAMSNIATTFRAMGNLRDAEQWWMHAIRLRPSHWDAVENLIGFLCNPYQTMGADIPGDARQPQFHQALVVCKSVFERLIPGPTIQSCLSTGLIRVGEAHRLQNLFHTSGNLKFILASRNEHETDLDKEFAGIKDQFVAVELMLNGRVQDEQPPQTYLTVHDLLLGLAVSALRVTGNLPPISILEIDGSNLDLLPRIHTSYRAVLDVVAPNNILPLVFIKPENIFTTMRQLFASTKGLFPGVVYEAGSLNLEAIPPILPPGATNASRMTATVLLTIAKHFQDAARRGISLPNFSASSGQDAPAIRASLSGALLLYYCALALHPSASVCNNLGILLSTLPGVRMTCMTQPPGVLNAAHPETETLTGPALARAYYQEGLKLDPNHPHLLTNVGSLLKDEGKLEEAMQMYSRALEIKPDFDVALANMANATKDAGNILESVEYYKRAVLSNPYFPESIVGLANALGSICDWQGRGGLTIEMYLDNTGSVIVRNEEAADSRTPGFLDKLIEICDSQILEGYHASTGIIASDRTLEQWMETIEACLGTLNPTRRERWEAHLKRFYTPFDRAGQRVYEAGTVVRLVEMLSRVLQRRWYIDQYRSNVRSASGATREPDLSKYNRPKLPAAMVAPLALSILPFQTFTLPLTTRMIRIISHRNAIRTSYLALSQDWLPSHVYAPPAPPSEGRLKVGYISSDFNNHPLSHLMQSVFDFHDAKRFEVYCYATTKSDGSKYRARIETGAHHFVDVTSWPTSAVVEKIQTDGIHILVNLNGYTKGARNDIFAVRPAPIIISLMGFAGTMSAGWSDYILTDPYASSPPGSALDTWRACWRDKAGLPEHPETISLEHNLDIDLDPESVSEDWMFSEKFIIMPHTCFVTDHKQAFRGDDRENDAALRARGRSSTPELIWKLEEMRRHRLRKELFPDVHDSTKFVFVHFANLSQTLMRSNLLQVEPVVFNAWLRILAQTPKSILWLLRFPTVAEPNIIRCARQWAGPEITSRIRFTDVAPKEKHIERCRVADLFLDTIECNAHTVATDVLWSGTPIVTWPRYEHKMCSRVAASIAYATGYGRHMVVSNLKEYEDRAIDFANSLTFVAASDDYGGWYRQCRGALSDLRRNLYLNRDHMPLFDTMRWTRNVERGYSEAWRRWESGTEFENSEEWLACSGEERESACIRISEN